MSPKRLRGILLARGIQGIVFVATLDPEMPIQYLDIGRDFACAIVGVRFSEVPFHVVTNDYLGAGRLCVCKLLEMNYRRPAILLPRGVDQPLAYAFTGGFASGLAGLPEEDRLPIMQVGRGETRICEEEDEEIVKRLLESRPDVLVSTDYAGALRLQKALRERGLELGVVSGDWFPGHDDGGINFRQRRLGEAAVDAVVAQLHRGSVGMPEVQRTIQVGAVWVDREQARERAKAKVSPLLGGQRLSA